MTPVNTIARGAPDSRAIPLNMAPRKNVSSIAATASALNKACTIRCATAKACRSIPLCQLRNPMASIMATTASISTTPSANASANSRKNTLRVTP